MKYQYHNILFAFFTILLEVKFAELKCSQSLLDTMPLLDFPSFMGVWKSYAVYDGDEYLVSTLPCLKFEFKMNNNFPGFINGWIKARVEGNPGEYVDDYNENMTIAIGNAGRPGKWNIVVDNGFPMDELIFIVHTDYKQNALLALCHVEDGKEKLTFHMLARNPKGVVKSDDYKTILSKGYGFDVTKVDVTYQDDAVCSNLKSLPAS